MKIGVPTFGYQNFHAFEHQLAEQGYFSANLGDNMQSIAVRLLLQRLGVPDQDVVSVNRDSLASYDGPPVALVMNGVFQPWCFPLPPQVKPIFIGLCVKEETVVLFKDYFSRFQPIGCRDIATQHTFHKHGISAFVTGCLTLTIPQRLPPKKADKILVVYGAGAGAFPSSVLKRMPADHLDQVEFIYQRIPLFKYPLDDNHCHQVEGYAKGLLKQYATTAKLIVTPLHHAATPSIALGIPVIICRKAPDSRFGYLNEITRVYTPNNFDEIDWNPAPVNIEKIRQGLELQLARSISTL